MDQPELKIPCIPFGGCVGKTIAAVIHTHDHLLVRFTDGTRAGVFSGGEEFLYGISDVPWKNIGRHDLIHEGFATRAMFDAYDQAMENRKKWLAEQEELRERAEFDRLYKKFCPNSYT